MTLPTLIQNYKEKQTVNTVKATYSTFAKAFQLVVLENGSLSVLVDTSKTPKENALILYNELAKHLKGAKLCSRTDRCFGTEYLNFTKTHTERGWDTYENLVTASLPNGISFWVLNYYYSSYPQLGFDINGVKPPNQMGIDFFMVGLKDSGQMNFSIAVNEGYSLCDLEGTGIYNGYHCGAWIVLNGNMDYTRRNIKIDIPNPEDENVSE